LEGSNEAKLTRLKTLLAASETGLKGVEELETIFSLVGDLDLKATLELDLRLARGLNYYTGAIIEVKALDAEMGSITGGGRYDNLTGVFGLSGVSGVGISFGADRIFDVLNTLNLYPAEAIRTTTVLFTNFGEAETKRCLSLIKSLRAAGIAAELYPEAAKMKKQLSYANSRQIPYVAMIGETELTNGTVSLKHMQTGEQQTLSQEALTERLKA